MEPEQLSVEANRLTFGALAWGEPGAPLALFVHGYPDTAWTWRHLGPRLAADGWRCVAPFTRGYAPTGLAPDDRYGIDAQARDVLALHRALGGDERAALIGHDWGAEAAYGVLGIEPERFARVVTLAVPPLRPLREQVGSREDVRLFARQLRLSWYTNFQQLPGVSERSLDRLIPKLWRDWSPGYDGREDIARVFAAIGAPERRRAALRYYRHSFNPSKLGELFGPELGAPFLYLYGDRDGCIDPAVSARAPLPPGSRAELIPGTGHFLQLEAPERVNELIANWLGSPD